MQEKTKVELIREVELLRAQVRQLKLAHKQGETFRQLVEVVNDYAIFLLDIKGRIISWNSGARRIKGYQPAEIIGKHFSCFYTSEDQSQGLPDRALTTAAREKQFEDEGWRVRKDGTMFWAAVLITPLFDEQGNIFAFSKITRDVTERLNFERQLKQTNQTLETIFAAAPVAILTLDINNRVERWNPTAERIFGWRASEVVGKLLPIVPEDRYEEFLVLTEYVLQNNDLIDMEVRRVKKDGSFIDISLSIAPLRDANDQISGTIKIMVDITERKRAERRLALQYAVTRILAESANLELSTPKILEAICKCLDWSVGIFWIVDLNEHVLHCLNTWHKLDVEVSEFEAISKGFHFARGMGLPGQVWQNSAPLWMADMFDNGKFLRAIFASKVGLKSAFGFPILFKGEVLGVIEFFSQESRQLDKDVFDMLAAISSQIGQFIERKRVEQHQAQLQISVQKAAQEWQLTFDAIEFPMLILDRRGRVSRMNHAAIELAQSSRPLTTKKRLLGSNLKKIGDCQPWQMAAALVDQLQTTHSSITCQVLDHKTGRSWDIAASLFTDLHDSKERVIIVARDITDMVELQESVRRSEMMSALGSLMARVAHEVRNPLFSMTATLDAFEEDFRGHPHFKEYFEIARSELNRLTELMRDLLDYGKPPMQRLMPQRIDLVIEQAIQSCASMAERKGISINFLKDNIDFIIKMDSSRMLQVFQNLLENAINYAPANSEIMVEMQEHRIQEHQWLECSIKDSGPGFHKEDLTKIFEPFFTRRHGGTGLGLSIVQRIVEQHGGKVIANNLPSGGAIVTVRLPAVHIFSEVLDVQK